MQSQSQPIGLSVAVRTSRLQNDPNVLTADRASRLLNTASLSGGSVIGRVCNRLAHQLGHGPGAVVERILKELDTGPTHLLSEVGGKLERNCLKLTKYALQTDVPAAQLKAFKSIVHLTTRFPGSRHIFLRCKRLQAAGATRIRIIKLWLGVGPVANDMEWIFYLGFAASCICDEDKLAGLLENSKLCDLGYIPIGSGECSVIERLLVASESSDEFEPWVAIRYLGTILESSSFWVQQPHLNHQVVCKRLFQRARKLVEDLDVEHNVTTNILEQEFRGDVLGIDILTSALLNGARIWHRQEPIRIRPLGSLSSNFARLMTLVQHPVSQYLLPQSYNIVSSEYVTLVGMTYQCESVDGVVVGDSPSSIVTSTSRFASSTSAQDPVNQHIIHTPSPHTPPILADRHRPVIDTGRVVRLPQPADLSTASSMPERTSPLPEDMSSIIAYHSTDGFRNRSSSSALTSATCVPPSQVFQEPRPVTLSKQSFLFEAYGSGSSSPCPPPGQRPRTPRGPRPMTPGQQPHESTSKAQGMLASPGDPNSQDPEQPALSTIPAVSLRAPSAMLDPGTIPSHAGHSTPALPAPERESPVSRAPAHYGESRRLSVPSTPFIHRSPMKSRQFPGAMSTSSFSTFSLDNASSTQTPVTPVTSSPHRFSLSTLSKPSAWGEGLPSVLKGSIYKKPWR